MQRHEAYLPRDGREPPIYMQNGLRSTAVVLLCFTSREREVEQKKETNDKEIRMSSGIMYKLGKLLRRVPSRGRGPMEDKRTTDLPDPPFSEERESGSSGQNDRSGEVGGAKCSPGENVNGTRSHLVAKKNTKITQGTGG